MSTIKPTSRGKAGKHKSQDTFGLRKVRALRVCRVRNATDNLLMGMLRLGNEEEEPVGVLAGRRPLA